MQLYALKTDESVIVHAERADRPHVLGSMKCNAIDEYAMMDGGGPVDEWVMPQWLFDRLFVPVYVEQRLEKAMDEKARKVLVDPFVKLIDEAIAELKKLRADQEAK